MQTLEAPYMLTVCTAMYSRDSMSCHGHPNIAHARILIGP